MYHCHIHFYLMGQQQRVFEMIRKMSPLEHFTHEFFESDGPEKALTAKADVILADLRDSDVKKALQILISGKRREAQIILLADKEQIPLLGESLSEITDIWTMPMSDEEMEFHFLRWQQTCKMSRDFWQTSQYLETSMNNTPNMIWYKDKEGVHEKVNDSFCRIVNKTKEQVEGQKHAYIWDVEQDDPACEESELRVMQKRETCISEEIVKTGDGTRLLTTYKSPLYDWDGSVMGTVGMGIDITQERAYEEEIIRKNHTLETIFTAMDCGILCHTVDGSRILSINKAALKILGFQSQDEMMGKGFDMTASSVVEEDRKRLRECMERLEKEGDSVSVEYRVRHADGEIRHIMGNIKLLRENGELFYQRFLLDCTTQKLQEEKERLESERRQMELVYALGIDYNLVCFFDLDTGIGSTLRIDDDGSHMFNAIFDGELVLEDCMEQYIQGFVYQNDKEMLQQLFTRENLKKRLEEKRLYYVNYRIARGDEIKYFQVKIVRIGTWEKSHGIVIGFCNVDEEIRMEIEKKNQLENALMQANRANKAKSTFLSNMSHDIRTPMNAIVGFTSLAITHIDRKEQVQAYLKKIMASGNHLLSLINDVLDMSRIESGKMRLEEKPCKLLDIIDELQSILQGDIRAKQLKLQVDTVNVSDEGIYCDKLRLNQILLNLLSNAVKYTDSGGSINMRVTEKPGAPAGSANYEFYIKDTGIGMSEEFVSHIFEPFERERNSTISGIQGTGLGMAITKNIIDMMKGSIEVESTKGVGTEITVSFTFRLCTDINADEAEEKDISRQIGQIRTGRILLVEDNELNQEIAATILEEAGFSTEIAGNGQIAVDMVKKSEPGYYQLVLMDVQMPVMNGYEATKLIRGLENKELSAIPILAMTANAFEEDKQEALRCGMNGHIAKPINVANLFATMSKILN
ncbi:MAG: PAS domain S-box protein [Bacteroidales bacterium]|nr:PAS domain S-box protein [Clostridium sp.]MCM1203424.1 PAS domain S-box protein [Bacteroidales bacterium]